jgi:transcription elongation factor Elf1
MNQSIEALKANVDYYSAIVDKLLKELNDNIEFYEIAINNLSDKIKETYK